MGQEVNEKEMKNRIKETDRRIQNALIWKNTELTDRARKAVNSYLGLVNLATHKSSLGLAINVKLAQRGEPINLLPTFHAQRTEVSSNILHPNPEIEIPPCSLGRLSTWVVTRSSLSSRERSAVTL